MGWSGGMGLLAQSWDILKPMLDKNGVDFETKVEVCEELIELFEEEDADTHNDLYDIPEMYKALQNLHPDWEWDEDEEDIDDENEEY